MTINVPSPQQTRSSLAPLDFFWFIPTHGDGSYLGTERLQRPPDFGYFKEIAGAVDRLGFPGVLLPTGQNCEDSWITAAGLAAHTERLKFLVALRPGVTTPTFAARQTAALDRLSGGGCFSTWWSAATRRSLPATGCSCRTTSATRRRRSFSGSGARWFPARP